MTNEADAILDFLKESDSQRKVLQAYEGSREPKKVKVAILSAKEDKDFNSTAAKTPSSRHPGLWHRLVSLESRASLRQNVFSILYLPIVYFVFGAILSECTGMVPDPTHSFHYTVVKFYPLCVLM